MAGIAQKRQKRFIFIVVPLLRIENFKERDKKQNKTKQKK